MQWLIQNSGVTFECLDRNVDPLVAALDVWDAARGGGIVPFTDTITGLEEIDRGIPTVFYGDTSINGSLCTFADERHSVFNCLAGDYQRLQLHPHGQLISYYYSADFRKTYTN